MNDKIIINKIFIRFLKEHNLYKQYINYFYERNHNLFRPATFKNYVTYYGFKDILDYLKWDDCKTEFNKWLICDKKWDNFKIFNYDDYHEEYKINQKYINLIYADTKYKKIKLWILYEKIICVKCYKNIIKKLSNIEPLEWILIILVFMLFSPIFVLLFMLIM